MRKAIVNELAIDLWQKDMYSLQMIGDYFGVTRQAVRVYLRRRDIDTGKTIQQVVCDYCGKAFEKPRERARRSRKHYCCSDHYYASIDNPDYNANRQGQRNARTMVKRCGFLLASEHVVHHKDSDNTNNEPDNLLVFASQAEHMRWHRAGGAESGVVPVFP